MNKGTKMKDRRGANTFLFLLCLCLYFLFGLIWKFTGISQGSFEWYHAFIILPLGIVGWFMVTYPLSYIKNKLQDLGMYETKADTVAFIVWIGFLVIWAIIFGGPR